MKTLFKFALFSVLTVTAAAAVLNWDDFKAVASTGRKMIERKIDEVQGMETKLSILREKVAGLGKEILELKTDLVRRQVDVEYMEKIVDEKRRALARLETALEQASRLLAEPRDTYLIGGRAYSREAVSRDAEEKMKLYKIRKETLANLEKTLETKRKTLEMARRNVERGESMKAELAAKVKFLEARVDRYKAKEVYADTVKVEDPSVEFKTLLGRTRKMLDEFERQLAVKDRLLDERIRLGGDYTCGIDYAAKAEEEGGTADLTVEIARCLHGGVASLDAAEKVVDR